MGLTLQQKFQGCDCVLHLMWIQNAPNMFLFSFWVCFRPHNTCGSRLGNSSTIITMVEIQPPSSFSEVSTDRFKLSSCKGKPYDGSIHSNWNQVHVILQSKCWWLPSQPSPQNVCGISIGLISYFDDLIFCGSLGQQSPNLIAWIFHANLNHYQLVHPHAGARLA